jgi:secernin
MCDTIVALGNATQDGSVLFAKNSDREPNEAHEVVVLPRQKHVEGSMLRCTYIEIPQVGETYAVLLSKPFWMWGAEMGANEYGVAIGNEAVFTKIPYEKGPGLTGMDMLRVALERANSARAALDVITTLLETYGQGGNCGFTHPFYYHNSFIIADPFEAWVLETAGKQWAAEKVKSVRSISNAITIGSEWDLASAGLVDYAVERGWCKGQEDFHFARCYSDRLITHFSDARTRQCRSTDLLNPLGEQHSVTLQDMFNTLRDHGGESGSPLAIRQSLTGCDVCMHAGFGPIRINQSTGSMVSHLTPGLQTHWVTATAAPCTSVFKPVWIDSGLINHGAAPAGTYDPKSLWWQHEALHRNVLLDYAGRLAIFQGERDTLEASFLVEAEQCALQSPQARAAFTESCFERAAAATRRWLETVHRAPIQHKANFLFQTAWKKFNKLAKFPE